MMQPTNGCTVGWEDEAFSRSSTRLAADTHDDFAYELDELVIVNTMCMCTK